MLPSALAWNTDLQNFSFEDMVGIFKSFFLFNVKNHLWESLKDQAHGHSLVKLQNS